MASLHSPFSSGLSLNAQNSRKASRKRASSRSMPSGRERVDVQAAHFHVLHAASGQGLHRTLAGVGDALWPDARVVLVLDLQDVGVQLHPFAILLGADLLVGRVGRADRLAQAVDVALQVVVAGRQAGLGVVLVAQVAHPQAGGVGQVERVFVEALQLARAATQEAGVEGRRGAEQVHQQPAVAAEITNQGDVGGGLVVAFRQLAAFGLAQQRPEPLRQGEVVVDAGDALHGLAVAQRQALAVDVLQAADHRAAVAGDRDALLVRQLAGHRWAPQVFAVQFRTGEAVDALEIAQSVGDVGFRRRDELQQGLGVVGSDLRMGQGRTQGPGVGGERQLAVAIDSQAFALDAMQALGQQGQVGCGAEQSQAAGEKIAQVGIPCDRVPDRSPQYEGGPSGLQEGGRKCVFASSWGRSPRLRREPSRRAPGTDRDRRCAPFCRMAAAPVYNWAKVPCPFATSLSPCRTSASTTRLRRPAWRTRATQRTSPSATARM